MQTSKTFWSIIGAVIITALVVAIGMYYYLPIALETNTSSETESETANWNVYGDAENSFAIKYPKAWQITTSVEDKQETGLLAIITNFEYPVAPEEASEPTADQAMIYLLVQDNAKGLTAREFFDAAMGEGSGTEITTEETITVNEVGGVKIVYSSEFMSGTNVYFAKDSKFYIIRSVNGESDINNIVDSFRFIE